MYCIKCGGIIHLEAVSCFHCGTAINHKGNTLTGDWYDSNAENSTNRFQKTVKKIPISSATRVALWASLIIPALIMPYIFKLSFEKYRNMDSVLLDVTLSFIVFLIFYFTKKALYIPKPKPKR